MAWMPAYASANKETSQQFGIGQISDFDRRDEDRCAKTGFSKRPPTSRHIHWSQPSSPKRYRRNSGSCITIDFFNFDTRAFGEGDMFAENDDWFPANPTNYPTNLPNTHPNSCSNTFSSSFPSTSYPANCYVGQQSQTLSQQQFQQQPQQQQFQQIPYQYSTSNYQPQIHVYQHPQSVSDVHLQQQQRFEKTTEILKEGGLYDVAVKTATLIRQHEKSKKDLEELRAQTKLFLNDVLNNPENRKVSQVLQNLQHQQNNPHLSAEKAVRDLFDQSKPGNAR